MLFFHTAQLGFPSLIDWLIIVYFYVPLGRHFRYTCYSLLEYSGLHLNLTTLIFCSGNLAGDFPLCPSLKEMLLCSVGISSYSSVSCSFCVYMSEKKMCGWCMWSLLFQVFFFGFTIYLYVYFLLWFFFLASILGFLHIWWEFNFLFFFTKLFPLFSFLPIMPSSFGY